LSRFRRARACPGGRAGCRARALSHFSRLARGDAEQTERAQPVRCSTRVRPGNSSKSGWKSGSRRRRRAAGKRRLGSNHDRRVCSKAHPLAIFPGAGPYRSV